MAYGLIGGPSRSARYANAGKRRELPADMPMAEELIPPPMPTSMASGMQRVGGGLIGGGAPRMPTQPMAQMQAPAPVMQGGQTRTREQAKQAGLIGSAAPKQSGGLFEMFGYDPEGTGMQPLDWLFSSRQDVEAARARKAGAESKQRFQSSLDALNLSPQDRVRAEMDPEGFFRGMNEANTANMKPQTDTFYDPVAKQWMRKPLGPMAVAEGTDLVDPDTKTALYSNDKSPASQSLPEGMWYGPDGKGPPQPIPGYVDMRARIAAAGRAPDAAGAQYRPASPEELQTWNIPPGTPVKVNTKTGEPEVIAGAKPSSEYTPSQQSKFIQQAQTLDSVDGALKAYTDLLDSTGPQMWTTGIGGDSADAKKLDAARTAILIQAKELFNLGVLNGPDLDIISSAVPDVTGWDAWGKSPESAKAQLAVLSDYIARGRNQIPAELLERARPNQMPPALGAGLLAAQSGRPQAMQQPRQPVAQFNAPREAVQELMSDPSPEAMAEFDDAFGPGAAEAALNGSR